MARFPREGARVMVADINDANAERVLAAASEAGHRDDVRFVRTDVADVAGVVAFLASDDASFITGETVVVDGGLLARGPALFGEGSSSALPRASGLDKGTTESAFERRPRPSASKS